MESRRWFPVNNDNFFGNSCSPAVNKCNALYSFDYCRYDRESGSCRLQSTVFIYPRPGLQRGEITTVSIPKDLILTKQGATFLSRDKRMPTTNKTTISLLKSTGLKVFQAKSNCKKLTTIIFPVKIFQSKT